jgi:DNA polymerase I-like protein with 3'-5' exonuclease and polymerase domains
MRKASSDTLHFIGSPPTDREPTDEKKSRTNTNIIENPTAINRPPALPKLINKTTGRIHTNYNQTIAATGRLSSTDPNLQNIPVKGDGLGSEVRKAFVAEKGYQLLSLDYSQIELRIVAHLANDDTMLEVFRNGRDIHSQTAMAIFGVTEDKITKDMRRDAKTINFGILYGLSSFGLSSRIGEVSMAEAKDFIAKYFSAYPQVKYYIDQVKAEVNKNAAVKNLLGRVRKFPEIRSSQYFIRSAAERAAVNFPIQSLEADNQKHFPSGRHSRPRNDPTHDHRDGASNGRGDGIRERRNAGDVIDGPPSRN